MSNNSNVQNALQRTPFFSFRLEKGGKDLIGYIKDIYNSLSNSFKIVGSSSKYKFATKNACIYT